MAFEYKPRTRTEYVVRVDANRKGTLTEIYRGANRKRAEEICNFWDERVNSYLEVIHPPRGYYEQAMDKFDALKRYIETGGNSDG